MTNTVQENKETRSAFLLGADDGENDDEDKNGGLRRESSFADEGIVCLEWGPTETERRPSLELSAIVLVVVLGLQVFRSLGLAGEPNNKITTTFRLTFAEGAVAQG